MDAQSKIDNIKKEIKNKKSTTKLEKLKDIGLVAKVKMDIMGFC